MCSHFPWKDGARGFLDENDTTSSLMGRYRRSCRFFWTCYVQINHKDSLLRFVWYEYEMYEDGLLMRLIITWVMVSPLVWGAAFTLNERINLTSVNFCTNCITTYVYTTLKHLRLFYSKYVSNQHRRSLTFS